MFCLHFVYMYTFNLCTFVCFHSSFNLPALIWGLTSHTLLLARRMIFDWFIYNFKFNTFEQAFGDYLIVLLYI